MFAKSTLLCSASMLLYISLSFIKSSCPSGIALRLNAPRGKNTDGRRFKLPNAFHKVYNSLITAFLLFILSCISAARSGVVFASFKSWFNSVNIVSFCTASA